MSVKRSNKNNVSAATGILAGLKTKKQEIVDTEVASTDVATAQNVNTENGNENVKNKGNIIITNNGLSSKPEINSDIDLFEQAKELIGADEVLTRRTFTIEALTNTQLNELKVYIMPAIGVKKKWGYNEIVNLALKEFYARQKQLLQDKVAGK